MEVYIPYFRFLLRPESGGCTKGYHICIVEFSMYESDVFEGFVQVPAEPGSTYDEVCINIIGEEEPLKPTYLRTCIIGVFQSPDAVDLEVSIVKNGKKRVPSSSKRYNTATVCSKAPHGHDHGHHKKMA